MSIRLFIRKSGLIPQNSPPKGASGRLKIVQNSEYKYLIKPSNCLYLEFCAETGKQPEKPFKGSFNVRIGADLHRKATLAASAGWRAPRALPLMGGLLLWINMHNRVDYPLLSIHSHQLIIYLFRLMIVSFHQWNFLCYSKKCNTLF